MDIKDFDFDLPEELIAQVPLEDRSSSKLMIVDRENNAISHSTFSNIINEFEAGDVLVLNNTRVIPARLYGIKEDTKAKIELLLLTDHQSEYWEALVKPARRVKVGTVVSFGECLLQAECVKELDNGRREFKLIYDGILLEILEQLGEMPLPPYIHEKLEDQERYQTVYSKNPGSAAAPTAGLHFTKELMQSLKDKGVIITYVTLHVGLGTFRPVNVENVLEHDMHSEYFEITNETASILNTAKADGRRIISVGTTSTRTLETVYSNHNCFKEDFGWTNIFIYPGYEFKAIDGLITNFHLPKSTLIMLVSGFANRELILKSYKTAVEEKYRFFSFGDSMFIK